MSKKASGADDLSALNERLARMEDKLDKKASSDDDVLKNTIFGAGLRYQNQADEIDLREFWQVIWRNKLMVIATTITFGLMSIFFALMLPSIYRSTALLAPSEETKGGGLSALAGQYGGLASLAGINLSGGADTKVTTAIEVIKSRQFAVNIINKYDMLIPLMAAKDWDREQNKLIIDNEIYDEERNKWVRDVSPPKMPKPSMWEAYEKYSEILNISQDKNTGLVSVSVEHYSPVIAQNWTEIVVKEINLVMKEKDVSEAEKSIKYLNQQLEKTSVADMKSVFYQMIEEQTKTIMLAEVRDEYVFATIDPPVVAERKAKPKRVVIVLLGIVLGGTLALMFVFIRHLLRSGEASK